MTKQFEVYKCEVCGAIVEVLQGGGGSLVCCNKPMILLQEQTADQATEKHVPVVQKTASGMKVVVGSVPHPMEEKHYIQWIEAIAGGKIHRVFLKPGGAPEAELPVDPQGALVREYCNLHGLWKG